MMSEEPTNSPASDNVLIKDSAGCHDNANPQHVGDESMPNEKEVADTPAAVPTNEQPPDSEKSQELVDQASDVDSESTQIEAQSELADELLLNADDEQPPPGNQRNILSSSPAMDEGPPVTMEMEELQDDDVTENSEDGPSSHRRSSGRRRNSTILYNVDHEEPRIRFAPSRSPKRSPSSASKKINMETRKCQYCGLQKKSPSDLQRHMRKHTGEKPFVCQVEDCKKEFKAKRSVQYHEYMEHGIESKETNLMDRYRERKMRMQMEKQVNSDYIGMSRKRGRPGTLFDPLFDETGQQIKKEPEDWSNFSGEGSSFGAVKVETDIMDALNKSSSEVDSVSPRGEVVVSRVGISPDRNRNGVEDTKYNVVSFQNSLEHLVDAEYGKNGSNIGIKSENLPLEKPIFEDDDSNDSMVFIDKNGTLADQESIGDQSIHSMQSLSFSLENYNVGNPNHSTRDTSVTSAGSNQENTVTVDQESNTIVLDIGAVQLETGIDITNMTKEEKRAYFQSKRTCLHCGKVCPKPSDLRRHLLVHTGERPYKCRGCNRAFKSKGSLQYHEKTNHNFTVDLSQGLQDRYLKVKQNEYRRQCGEGDGRTNKANISTYDSSKTPCYQFFNQLDSGAIHDLLNQNLLDSGDSNDAPNKEYPQLCNALGGYDAQSMTGQWTIVGENDGEKSGTADVKKDSIEPSAVSHSETKSSAEEMPPASKPNLNSQVENSSLAQSTFTPVITSVMSATVSQSSVMPVITNVMSTAVPQSSVIRGSTNVLSTAVSQSTGLPVITNVRSTATILPVIEDVMSLSGSIDSTLDSVIAAGQSQPISAPNDISRSPEIIGTKSLTQFCSKSLQQFGIQPIGGSDADSTKPSQNLEINGAKPSQREDSHLSEIQIVNVQTLQPPMNSPLGITPNSSRHFELKIPSVISQHSGKSVVSDTPMVTGSNVSSANLPNRTNVGTGSRSQEHLMSLIRAPPAPLPSTPNPEILALGSTIHYRGLQSHAASTSTTPHTILTRSAMEVKEPVPNVIVRPPIFNNVLKSPMPDRDRFMNDYNIIKETTFITKLEVLNKGSGENHLFYKCYLCMGKVFDSMDKMKDHIASHMVSLSGDKGSFRCPVCQATYKFRVILLRHLRSMHHWNVEEREDYGMTNQGVASGEVINVDAEEEGEAKAAEEPSLSELEAEMEHEDSHTGLTCSEEEVYEGLSSPSVVESLTVDGDDGASSKLMENDVSHDDMIKNVYKSNNHITNLLDAASKPTKRFDGLFRCKYCPKTFFRFFCLQRHERVHTGVKTCFCKQCGRGFSELRNLRHHILRFHSGLDRQELFKMLGRGSPSKKTAEPYVKGLIGRENPPLWDHSSHTGPLQLPVHPPERPPSVPTSASSSPSPFEEMEKSSPSLSFSARQELRSHLEEKIRRKEGVSDDVTIVIPSDMPLDDSSATATEPEDALELTDGQGHAYTESGQGGSTSGELLQQELEANEGGDGMITKQEVLTTASVSVPQSLPDAADNNLTLNLEDVRVENPSLGMHEPVNGNESNPNEIGQATRSNERVTPGLSVKLENLTSQRPLFSPNFLSPNSMASQFMNTMPPMNLQLSVNTNGPVQGIQMSPGSFSHSPRGFLSPNHMPMLQYSNALISAPGSTPMFQAPMTTSAPTSMSHGGYPVYPVRQPYQNLSYLNEQRQRLSAPDMVIGESTDEKYVHKRFSSLSRTNSRVEVACDPEKHEQSSTPVFLPDGRTLFRCAYCSKEFPNYSDIRRHLNFHEDVRPFKCKMCQYSARTSSQLKVHMMRHQGIRQFKCKICHYEGVTQSDLNRHLRSQSHIYLERMGNKCKKCGEDYTSRQVMNHGHICKYKKNVDQKYGFPKVAHETEPVEAGAGVSAQIPSQS